MPKISVILTSFNHEKYIQQAIDSVLCQSFEDFELIIWDDASTDNSWEIIKSYTDNRIKIFRNEKQKRGIWGINQSISNIANGHYIAIHHSDDIWEHDKLQKQVSYLDANSHVGAVFTWVQTIDENGTLTSNEWFNQEQQSRWTLLNQLFSEQNHLNHPSVLIRKKCYEDIGLYRFGLAQTADAEMWSRLLLKCPVHIINEKLTLHRLFSDDSNTSGGKLEAVIRSNNEWNIVRSNFLRITELDDLLSIFPQLNKYSNPEGFNCKFLLAMVCLEQNQRSAWQLGLSWLLELLNEDESREMISKLYSFTYMDFIKLSTKYDIYLTGSLLSLNTETIENPGETKNAFTEALKANDIISRNTWLETQCEAWEKIALEREQQIAEISTWSESQRSTWEQLVKEREQQIAKMTSHLHEVTEGSKWLDNQRQEWKKLAEDNEQELSELRDAYEKLRNSKA